MDKDNDKENEGLELPKEIYEELEKISNMEETLEKFNNAVKKSPSLSEEKKEDNVIKKDEISSILSSKEKKRYENLGKAFMEGANNVISEIQSSIEKKERNSLENKENIENKIKEAKIEKEKNEKKKGSVIGKILIATAAIGGLYLIFHKTINSGIMNMYESVKNGMMGFGDFIKKSASAIFSFFGNMFIKASEALNGGGLMTTILVGIIKEFFGLTLPKLVIHLTQDFVRMIDSSFTATEWKPDKDTNVAVKKMNEGVKTETDGLFNELSKAKLHFEKDIIKNSSLSTEEQEKLADESVKDFGYMVDGLIQRHQLKSSSEISKWLNGIFQHLASNQISSTALYHNTQQLVESIEKLNIGDSYAKLNEREKTFVDNFANNYGHLFAMTEAAIAEYNNIDDGEAKLKFMRDLISSFKSHNAKILDTVQNGKSKTLEAKKEEEGVVKILREIKDDVDKKGATTTIIQFQETKQIGDLQNTIKSFINNTKFVEVMTKFAGAIQGKFDMVLDASNKALSRISEDIASEFVLETVEEVNGNESTSTNKVTSNEPDSVLVPDDEDYKIMYIFNNTSSQNDESVLSNMNTFFQHTAQYLEVMTKEVESVTILEALTHHLYEAILTYTLYSRNYFNNSKSNDHEIKNIKIRFDNHVKTPVRNGDTTAHNLIIGDLVSAPLSQSYGGFNTLC